MDCERANELITARIDGEIGDDDAVGLDGHLAECAACRVAEEAHRLQDGELRRAFGARRQAAQALGERVARAVEDEAARTRPRRGLGLIAVGLAIAAGFLAAVVIERLAPGTLVTAPDGDRGGADRRARALQVELLATRRLAEDRVAALSERVEELEGTAGRAVRLAAYVDELEGRLAEAGAQRERVAALEERCRVLDDALATARRGEAERVAALDARVDELERALADARRAARGAVPEALGHLALATGALEARAPGDAAWRPLATGAPLAAGFRVRTLAGVRCELRMVDGSEVRLDGATEVVLPETRRFELASGRLYSNVARAETPFVCAAAGARITALGTAFDVHVTGAREALLTVVQGATRVDLEVGAEPSGDGAEPPSEVVRAGEQLRIAEGRLGRKARAGDLVIATRWVNEILILKGRDDPELDRRVRELFATIGRSKLQYLQESEIRALGDHCFLPLVRYIQSEDGMREATERVRAARIAADIATPWAIPHLIGLLANADGDVRYYAARALERLTGTDQGRSPEGWRDAGWATCSPTHTRWQAWWGENKERFPGAP